MITDDVIFEAYDGGAYGLQRADWETIRHAVPSGTSEEWNALLDHLRAQEQRGPEGRRVTKRLAGYRIEDGRAVIWCPRNAHDSSDFLTIDIEQLDKGLRATAATEQGEDP